MAKQVERKVRSEQEAGDCLARNGVRMDSKLVGDKMVYTIKLMRPVGLKVRGAIDCLLHYHKGYRLA